MVEIGKVLSSTPGTIQVILNGIEVFEANKSASRMKIRCSIVVLQSKISEGQEVWTLHTRCIIITDQSFLPEFAAVRG